MRSEYEGSIIAVREVEDSIRVTKKYTKGAFSKPIRHLIQGEDFPSKVLTEYYEVYPDLELSWDMAASDAWAWVWGDVVHINIHFHYDYKQNRARIVIYGGNGTVKALARGIPRFAESLAKVVANGRGNRH